MTTSVDDTLGDDSFLPIEIKEKIYNEKVKSGELPPPKREYEHVGYH